MNHHYYTAKFAFVFSGHLPLIKDISSIITTVGQQKLCKKTSLFLCQQQQRWKERQKTEMDSLPQPSKLLSVQVVPFKSLLKARANIWMQLFTEQVSVALPPCLPLLTKQELSSKKLGNITSLEAPQCITYLLFSQPP